MNTLLNNPSAVALNLLILPIDWYGIEPFEVNEL